MSATSLPKPQILLSKTQRYDPRSGTPTAHRIVTSSNRSPYHFVAHGPRFQYDDYGIHRGQMDRLSFFAADPAQMVTVHMYDCRQNSDEFDRKMTIAVPADGSQVLQIPPGYAHWFTGLENVATRNDYAILGPSFGDSRWNPMNDDHTVKVEKMDRERPQIRANDTLLPQDAQFLISTMVSQSWRGGAHMADNAQVRVVDRTIDLLIQDDVRTRPAPQVPDVPSVLATVAVALGTYQQVREDAVTVASHVPSGVAQTLYFQGDSAWPQFYSAHPYISMQLTMLTVPSNDVQLDIIDRRIDSPSFGERCSVELPQDPRLCLRLEPGVLWRMQSENAFHYRVEYEIHEHPAGPDLPAFMPIAVDEADSVRFATPGPPMPPAGQRLLALDE